MTFHDFWCSRLLGIPCTCIQQAGHSPLHGTDVQPLVDFVERHATVATPHGPTIPAHACCLANFFANSGVQYWSTFSTAHTQQTIDRLYTDLDTVAARAEQ